MFDFPPFFWDFSLKTWPVKFQLWDSKEPPTTEISTPTILHGYIYIKKKFEFISTNCFVLPILSFQHGLVKGSIWALQQTVRCQKNGTSLNGSDHSTHLKTGPVCKLWYISIRYIFRNPPARNTIGCHSEWKPTTTLTVYSPLSSWSFLFELQE